MEQILTSPKWSKLWRGELVAHGDNDADRAKQRNEEEVTDLRRHATVEAVVEPGYKGANGQQRYPAVVEPTQKTTLGIRQIK